MATATAKRDLHEEITQNIIEAIEEGASGDDFTPPWITMTANGIPENATTHKQYRGVNVLQLWATAQLRDFTLPYWATFKQWQSVGAQVRKGEKGTRVVFYRKLTVKDRDSEDDNATRTIPMLRYSTVFNADQVEDWTNRPAPVERPNIAERISELDAFIDATGATIKYNGGSAHYDKAADVIGMPERDLFKSTEGFYCTAFHELTHWTGHEKRLDRKLANRFGSEEYAAEELIAELGSAFLAGSLGLAAKPREDHARYIDSWLSLLRSDKKAIFTAAARASDATAYLSESE